MLAAGFGFVALLGWVLELPLLASMGSGRIPMAPSTALLFVIYGSAMFFCSRAPLNRGAYWIGMVVGVAGALVALLLSVLTARGIYPQSEYLGMAISGSVGGAPIGHISPLTASCFVLGSLSFVASLSSSADGPRRATAGFVFACLLVFASIVFLLAYLFGTPIFYGGKFIPPALTTSLAFTALGVGLLALAVQRVWSPGDQPVVKHYRHLIVQWLLLVAAMVLPLTGVIAYLLYVQLGEAKATAYGLVREVAEGIAEDSETFLQRTEAMMAYLAKRPMIRAGDARRCDPLIVELQRMNPIYVNIILADGGGRVVCWALTQSSASMSYADREWFRQGIKSRGFRIDTPVFGRATGKWLVNMTTPVHGDDGSFAALLVVATGLDEFNRFVGRPKLPEGSVITIVDDSGTIISRSLEPEKWLGKDGRQIESIAATLAQRDGTASARGADGVERLFAFTTIPNVNWHVSAGIPTEIVLSQYHETLRAGVLAATVFVAVLCVIAVAAWVAMKVLVPIRSLADAAKAVSQGNLDARAVERGPIEIAETAVQFNRMLAALTKTKKDLEKHAAQLAASHKDLEGFSYSVSHDLRAPLRAIDGFSRILLEDYASKLDDEGRRLLTVVRDSTQKMGQLINDILAFSRAGRAEISVSEINIDELAAEIFDQLKPAAAGRTVNFRIHPLPPACADRAMMRQVLTNLLSNAIKFTRTRGIANIEVSGHAAGEENIYLVKDDGVGFDPRYTHKLFGVFQRLHSAEEFEGTGIGLAIVKRIIDKHGGRVWAEPKPGEGAAFYFSVPRRTPGATTGGLQ
jgi:signal transduction histidine kinase